ncbi:jouberin-like [Perca fluviatilis]|uniref:jouberin-like n=1 Tax=Perca fluviatilis TaxID=8168 RepID=UPI001963A851|nr:jouberin-like [Perca fluviatilis]
MQQIYRQSNQEFEVFTTVFSPQVSRARTRTRHVETEVLVVKQHRSRWQRELDLDPGDLIQVLVQEDEAWWFGRLANGDEGYFLRMRPNAAGEAAHQRLHRAARRRL